MIYNQLNENVKLSTNINLFSMAGKTIFSRNNLDILTTKHEENGWKETFRER